MTLHTTLPLHHIGSTSLGINIPRWFVEKRGLKHKDPVLLRVIGNGVEYPITRPLLKSSGHGSSYSVIIPQWCTERLHKKAGDPLEVVIE